jgi:hypothetical protein
MERYFLVSYDAKAYNEEDELLKFDGWMWFAWVVSDQPDLKWAKNKIKETEPQLIRVRVNDIYEFKNRTDFDRFRGIKS